jgi:hypothetical protein
MSEEKEPFIFTASEYRRDMERNQQSWIIHSKIMLWGGMTLGLLIDRFLQVFVPYVHHLIYH